MSSPGPARNGRPNNRTVTPAPTTARIDGRQSASRIQTITAAAITTIAAIPNCGFTIAASPATAPAVAQRPRPASTSAAMSGRVPTASTCPQYGPAKIGPGESIQTAAARTAYVLPDRHTSDAAITAMPMSAGTDMAFSTKLRSGPPPKKEPKNHRT